MHWRFYSINRLTILTFKELPSNERTLEAAWFISRLISVGQRRNFNGSYDTLGKRVFPNTAKIKDPFSRGNEEQPHSPCRLGVEGRWVQYNNVLLVGDRPLRVRIGGRKCYLESADDVARVKPDRMVETPAGSLTRNISTINVWIWRPVLGCIRARVYVFMQQIRKKMEKKKGLFDGQKPLRNKRREIYERIFL